MRRRRVVEYRPDLDRLEEKRPLSGGLRSAPPAHREAAPAAGPTTSPVAGVTMERITQPNAANAVLVPPFPHVLVQSQKPIAGQVYNVLSISVRNSTARTFTAADDLTVNTTDQKGISFPVLTGDQVWKPGERFVFYVLSKRYYPLIHVVSGGFRFNFVDPQVTAIPGPSGIFLRLKYDPATFDKVLDNIVVFGPGAKGHQLGLPDTALWELIPANTHVVPL